jgi:hypothetical protein
MANLIKYRAFKIDVIPATNTIPTRVKITDLRVGKCIIIHYSAKSADTTTQLVIEYLTKLGIAVVAKAWAEVDNKFAHDLLLTENFSITLKKLDE